MHSAYRFAVAVGALGLGAVPALAQEQPAVLQPETAVVSPGGVDMNTGQYRDEGTDLSIGSEANGGITMKRVDQKGKPFTTNWHIFLNHDCDQKPPQGETSTTCTIVWKLESMQVTKSWLQYIAGGAMAEQGIPSAGATKLEFVSPAWRFTLADGSEIRFENGSNTSGDVWATSLTRKDGVIYTFTYDSGGDPEDGDKRLRRVTSNTGYELIFEYSGTGNDNITKACVFSTAVVTPPSGNSCPTGTGGQGMPGVQTVSYARAAGGNPVTSITDAVGKVWTINRSGTVSSYIKPGTGGTPWLVNTKGPAPDGGFISDDDGGGVVLSQQLADGRTIDYSYANLLIYESDPPQLGILSGRGVGWTVNGTRSTSVGWQVAQQQMSGQQPGPLFISPAPTVVVDPLGRVSGAVYQGNGAVPYGAPTSKSLIGGRGETYTYVGTSAGGQNLASRTSVPSTTANGETSLTTSYTYDCTIAFNCAKPATITDPKGNVTDYVYDSSNGLLLSETMPADAGGVRPKKTYNWVQKQATFKNSSGVLGNGASVWVIDSISQCRTSASCAGTADETRTTFTYPAAGTANNLLPTASTVQNGNGTLIATTTFTYDVYGNKVAEDGPLAGTGDTSRWAYDLLHRVTHSMTPDPDGAGALKPLAVRNTYDDAGRLTKVENGNVPSGATDWSAFTVIDSVETDYDLLDRKTQERKKDNGGVIKALTQYSYDSFGRLECTAVRMSPAVYGSLPASACTLGTAGADGPDRITKNTYDAGDQLLTVTEAFGTPDQAVEATYTYTSGGKKATLTDARGFKASMTYDGHDRQIRWSFPDKVATGTVSTADYEAYTYDNNGNRTSLRKRDGSTLTFAYDNLNRMVTKVVPGSTPTTRDVYLAYDLQGHQTSARFDSQSGEGLTSTYDALGRVTGTTLTMNGVSRSLGYGHDIRGFRTSLTHPDSNVFTYTPDTIGRLTTLAQGATTLRGFGYDGNGRLTSAALGNGTPGSTTLGYDTIGRLNVLSHNITGSANDVAFSFTYSPASQTLTQTRDNDAYAWTGAVVTDRSYVANGLNQYTAAGGTGFTYDDNGNLTGSTDSAGSWAYAYDVENRLVLAVHTPVSGPVKTTSLRYDPMGRLYEVTGSTSGTTRFLYDGDELVAEYDGSGALLRRYVHGIAVDDPVVWYEGSGIGTGALRHLIADRQGSIIGITDSNGTAIAKNTYDEYGIPKSSDPGQFVVGRFAYTGQIWIPELGMYHYKARLYSPTLGRFLQTDPIGYDDQINLYAYVGNDPVNHSDPSGTTCKKDGTDCKIDEPGKMTEIQQQEATTSYQGAVNKLLKDPERKVTLKSEAATGSRIPKQETTTQGAMAHALINARVSYHSQPVDKEGNAVKIRAEAGGLAGSKVTPYLNLFPRYFLNDPSGRMSRSTLLGSTFIHESGHMTLSGQNLVRNYNSSNGEGAFSQDHQVPWNQMARGIWDGN